MSDLNIQPWALALGYLLLIVPLGLALWLRVKILSGALIAVARMTAQLLLVGLYLQVVFRMNAWWLTLLWLVAMTIVADLSIVNGCGLRLGRFFFAMFAALLAGTLVPLLVFAGLVFRGPGWLDARYFIPIAGMIMGNCLRANIVGLSRFYEGIRDNEPAYLLVLSQGARLSEATLPHLRAAFHAAMAPTIATMATIGLVALPGMMTGIILGGADPMTAIQAQIAIMIAIFSGTAITVVLGIWMTMRRCFTPYGILDREIFRR